jgi:hypothetical protein
MSVAFRNRRLAINFRYALVCNRNAAAMQHVAEGQATSEMKETDN